MKLSGPTEEDKHYIAGEKTVLSSRLYVKTIFLPRQARDKHRESTQKRDCRFLADTCGVKTSTKCVKEMESQVGKRSFKPFVYKNDDFTKTGSGQT